MNWHTMAAAEAVRILETDPKNGLTAAQAAERLARHGPNRLEEKRKKNLFERLIGQLSDFMVIVLLAAAAISFGVELWAGHGDLLDPIVIITIVLVNSVLGVVQESKAEAAIEALKRMAAPASHVVRSGATVLVPAEQIVSGDLIRLEAGDLIPADARLLEASNLKIEEASLTGESVPVDKRPDLTLPAEAPLGDRRNMAFASCIVTGGRATAVVTSTGMETQVGAIARMLDGQLDGDTPLQQKLAHTGKLLGAGALAVCLVLFAIGLIQAVPPLTMFMLSVSLAVAAIPEGLPAIVTIALAIGVQRMAKSNAIVRRLPAVETLGGATVICSDKTGTLTQNRMTVTAVAAIGGRLPLEGAEAAAVLSLGALCNNSTVTHAGEVEGDPTETALVSAALRGGMTKQTLDDTWPRIGELPFDSERKLMTTVHRAPGGGYRVVTKGAPDVLLGRCTHYARPGGGATAFTAMRRDEMLSHNENMAAEALRVLAVAYRDCAQPPSLRDPAAIEDDLTFCGLIGMIDPPRPEVRESVRVCREAGIRPVMITGDHVVTARAIARELGILRGEDESVTGAELDEMDEKELGRRIGSIAVFARVSPAHKVRIVKAWQARGAVVAMTGDGVNDAPALKAADIGCAMGKTGTDVARGAADMILTDDNFATIVAAVREGRGIYQNIRRAVHFLLSCNFGEILTIFVSFLMGLPSPLLAIQLLWVNLVTDSLPALALSVEAPDPDIMRHKPVDRKQSLFSGGLFSAIAAEGALIGTLSMTAFALGRLWYDGTGDPAVGRTMAFSVLALSQLVHAMNVRSDRSLFKIGLTSNRSMIGAFFVCLALQAAVVTLPAAAAVFKTVPMTGPQWLIVAGLSLVPLVAVEIQKWLAARDERRGERTEVVSARRTVQRPGV